MESFKSSTIACHPCYQVAFSSGRFELCKTQIKREGWIASRLSKLLVVSLICFEDLFQFRRRINVGLWSCNLALYDGANQLEDNFSTPVNVLGILVDWIGSRCGHMQKCNLSSLLSLVAVCQAVEKGEIAKKVARIV